MAYVPKDWVTGEVITEQALDRIEQGIANAGGVLVVTFTRNNNEITADKTYQTIIDAENNKTIYGIFDMGLVTKKLLYAYGGRFFNLNLQEGGATLVIDILMIDSDEYVEEIKGTCTMTPVSV